MKRNDFKLKKVFFNFFIFIILMILDYIKSNYIYFICQNCLKENILDEKCSKCDADIFFKSIKYKSKDETLNELLYFKKSISRFGDGEFKIIFGKKIGFQNFNEQLKEKLLI